MNSLAASSIESSEQTLLSPRSIGNMHLLGRLAAGLIVEGSSAMAAASPVPDSPLRTGYEQLYQGDVKGALEYFRALAAREPNNLGAPFSVLVALHHLGLRDDARQREFERGIDQLI